jgi:hypothetical protein
MMRKRLLSAIACVLIVLALLSPVCHSANEREDVTGTPPGWTDDIRLTYNTTTAWKHTAAGQQDTYYMNSQDAGQTWSEVKQLSLGNPIDSRRACIDNNGDNLHVVWEDTGGAAYLEISYVNSTDGGNTWSSPRQISMDDGNDSSYPLLTVSGSYIHVVWIDDRYYVSPMWNREIYYARSVDGGITWDDGLGNVGQDRRLTEAPYGSGANAIVSNGSNIHVIFSDERESPHYVTYTT